MEWFLERARHLGIEHKPPAPIVLGRHLLALGMEPGPAIGAVLKKVYERQLDGEITNEEEGLAVARDLIGEA
jgi:tRNA nucleotidyltransferase (CCA-adding enzyme)